MILSGVTLGIVLAQAILSYRTLRDWRLSLRREEVLARSLRTLDELLARAVAGTLTPDELELGANLINVGIADELHAQARIGLFRRIPRVGEPWPDDLLAPVLDEIEE